MPLRASRSPRRPDLPAAIEPTPHPSRLSPSHPQYDQIIGAHEQASEAGDPTYTDPATGYAVMTRGYLLARGYCCESGCRHCPYLEETAGEPGA